MTNPFAGNSFLIKKKFMKLMGSDFRIYDAQQNEILFAHLKAFKLKEDITLYTDEGKTTPVINIKARQILDFSAAYDFYDMKTGRKMGGAKRKGFKSILQDEWTIMDVNDVEIGLVKEDSMLMAMLRRFVTNLIPQEFYATIKGEQVCKYKNNFNPFLSRVQIDISKPSEQFSVPFAIALGVLLCAIEGKQG